MRILAISFKVDASANLRTRVKRRCGSVLSSRFDSHTFHAFAKRIIDRFRPVLSGADALDVDYTIGQGRIPRKQITFLELVPLATQILESSEVALNAIRQTYSDVFLDEFQDCTNHQYKLVQLCFGKTPIRTVAVGDTKQKIMGWAGALDGVFIKFAKDFDATSLNLYRNFRSEPLLLRMQNEIVEAMDPLAKMPSELVQGDGGHVEILTFENDDVEAQSVATQVHRWCQEEGISPREIAILVRNNPDQYTRNLTAELERLGIAFRSEQHLQDLSAEPVTQLVIDYLLVVFGNREPDAYLRMMDKLTEGIHNDDEEFDVRDTWRAFLQSEGTAWGSTTAENRSMKRIWEYAKRFLGQLGKERLISLSAEYESDTRLRQVLLDTKNRLSELYAANDDIVKALTLFTDTTSAVRILTIHKSKGLEFDSVVMLGVEEESFWGKDKDEERSVFFVGISRAKSRLLLTHCATRREPENNTGFWKEARHPHEEFIGYAQPFC